MNGAPAKPMSGVAPSSRGQLPDRLGDEPDVGDLERPELVEVCRVADGPGDDRADPGLDVEVDADRRQRHDDVAEQDRRVHAIAAHRLHRDLGDQLGRPAGVEHRDALAELAVLRQRAAGLAHEPHRRVRHGLTTAGQQEGRVGKAGVARRRGDGHAADGRTRSRNDKDWIGLRPPHAREDLSDVERVGMQSKALGTGYVPARAADAGPRRRRPSGSAGADQHDAGQRAGDTDRLGLAEPLVQQDASQQHGRDGIERAEYGRDADQSAGARPARRSGWPRHRPTPATASRARSRGSSRGPRGPPERRRAHARSPRRPRPSTVTDVTRMPSSVISVLSRLPLAMNSSARPKPMAATTASTSGRTPAFPDSSGPLASTTPAMATTMPTTWTVPGRSPWAKPTTTGTTTPSAAIGETTPIVPEASAA